MEASGLMPSNDQSPRPPHEGTIAREIRLLRDMVMAEAATAVGMIEQACEALVNHDDVSARAVIARDDEVDRNEVRIEEECFRVMALFHPYARDFREITTLIKVNSDVERVADHATGIAKQTIKLSALGMRGLPTPLVELAQRVPLMCHGMLSAMNTDDAVLARELVAKDKFIDSLEKKLFEECVALMTNDRNSKAGCLILHRCGRELERVGDLMKNIAEDLIYLSSGTIVRHEAKRNAQPPATPTMPVTPTTPTMPTMPTMPTTPATPPPTA